MAASCPHPHGHALPRPTDGPLRAAEARVVAHGGSWTAPRRRTYELLLGADRPQKAYELIAKFARDARAPAPPTVYRALTFLLASGLAHRVESENAFVACRTPERPHTAGFVLCECCGRSEEISADTAQLARGAGGFAVGSVALEIRGLCPDCRGTTNAAANPPSSE